MPYRTRIQPIVGDGVVKKPVMRLKQLFERQFSLKNLLVGDQSFSRGDADEFEPSSVCLRKLVQNYMEDPNSGKQRCGGHNSCNNSFSESGTDSSSDEEEDSSSSFGGFLRSVKNLLLCANISEGEKNLVTKTTEIVKKNKHDSLLQTLVDELVALGYDAAICKSRWEQSRKLVCFAGEYNYLDVMIEGERVLIDIDFKSKFQIARPTKSYMSISQTLPYVFVGQVDRLKKIVGVVSDAAKKSMTKNGLPVPPWRRAEYVLNKWLAPYVRAKRTQGKTSENI